MTDQEKTNRKIEAMLWLLGFKDDDKLVPGNGWGDSSVAALKAYQKYMGLEPTGELNDETMQALNSEELAALPEYNGRKTFQCLCILADDCDDDGALIADDLGGDHTKVAFKALMRLMFDNYCTATISGLI